MDNSPAKPNCHVCGRRFVDRAFFFCLSKFAEYAPESASPNILLSILLCSGDCATRYFRELRLNGGGTEPNYDGYSHPASDAAGASKNFEGLSGQMPAPINDVTKIQQKHL